MTYDEATKLLIVDPTYPIDFKSMTKEDKLKLALWFSVCNMVLNQESIMDEWDRERGILEQEFGEEIT